MSDLQLHEVLALTPDQLRRLPRNVFPELERYLEAHRRDLFELADRTVSPECRRVIDQQRALRSIAQENAK